MVLLTFSAGGGHNQTGGVGLGLDAKFKISKLSYGMCVVHVWSIKSKRNKKIIA